MYASIHYVLVITFTLKHKSHSCVGNKIMKQPWVFHVGTVQTAISEEGVTSNIEKKERKNPD